MVIITTANSAASASNTCASSILRSSQRREKEGETKVPIDTRLSKNRRPHDESKEYKNGLIWIINTDVQGLPERGKSPINLLESRLYYKFPKESSADYLKRIFGFANPKIDYFKYASDACLVHGLDIGERVIEPFDFYKTYSNLIVARKAELFLYFSSTEISQNQYEIKYGSFSRKLWANLLNFIVPKELQRISLPDTIKFSCDQKVCD